MIPGRSKRIKLISLFSTEEIRKMKKWSDGVIPLRKKRTYNSLREELAYLDVTC